MQRSDDGQYEMVLENRQVLVIFFVAAALCGVFFALGYMVGKNSGTAYTPPQQAATPPVTGAESKRGALSPAETPAQSAPEPKKEAATPAEPTPSTPAAKAEAEPPKAVTPEKKETPPPPAPKASTPAAEGFITLQVAALSKKDDAEAMVALLKRKNFPVTLVGNSPDNLFRVQVGPYTSVKDAEAVKTRLEQEGFKPIVKK